MGDFYTSETDAQLAKDIVSQSADVYLAPVHPITTTETGVMNKAVPATTTITPAVVPAPVWVVDELIGNIVVLQDDNGKANEFVIADNDATSFTIDIASDVHGNDHSADYTDAATFAFLIWDAEEFLGYTEGSDEFTDEDEEKMFKRGVPREHIRSDLLENVCTLAVVVRTPGPGNLKLASNLDDTNSNATYNVLEKGSNPPARPYYYVILKNKNVNGDLQQLRLYKTQCKLNGSRVIGGGDEYEILPLLFTCNVDPLRGDETDGSNITNKYCTRVAK
jgi:hypothetical protein